MLIRRKWRIKNEHSKRAFYFVADPKDTTYALALYDLAGWIDPGESREIELRADNVKLGFRKGPLPKIHGWFAEPTDVSTNRDVMLSSDLTVEYRADGVEWLTPENGKQVFSSARHRPITSPAALRWPRIVQFPSLAVPWLRYWAWSGQRKKTT
jgi:hypothetical protein